MKYLVSEQLGETIVGAKEFSNKLKACEYALKSRGFVIVKEIDGKHTRTLDNNEIFISAYHNGFIRDKELT